jgi:hypothetical protein
VHLNSLQIPVCIFDEVRGLGEISSLVYKCAAAQSMDPWAVIKKALHLYGGDTSSSLGLYPTAACPEFHVG